MAKRSTVGLAAIGVGVVAAVYELIAYATDAVPTITEIIEDLPEIVELTLLVGALLWALDHFGWLRREDRNPPGG
jgi:hypothetical protein